MSLSKSQLTYLRSLSQKKYREQEGKFLLEGWRPLEEALKSDWGIEFLATISDVNGEQRVLLEAAKKKSIPVHEVSEKELGRISSTVHSQGVVALVAQRKRTVEHVLGQKPKIIVALDAVSDPGNLGSIIRTCDWFGVDAVMLGKGSVELYNEKVVRSTVGSIFHVPVVEDIDLPVVLKQAKQPGYYIAALSGDGKLSYTSEELKRPVILVFGSETHGISKEVRSAVDTVLSIPSHGSAESLNVGVACGIVLAHLRM